MQKWEYRVVTDYWVIRNVKKSSEEYREAVEATTTLCGWGEEGWELVAVEKLAEVQIENTPQVVFVYFLRRAKRR